MTKQEVKQKWDRLGWHVFIPWMAASVLIFSFDYRLGAAWWISTYAKLRYEEFVKLTEELDSFETNS